jgi:hypothetical protein
MPREDMESTSTEEEKIAVIRELLIRSNEGKDDEVKKRKAEDLAWARKKRDVVTRRLLSSSGRLKVENRADKWKMDATMDDLVDGSYNEDHRNPEDNVEWYMKMETDEYGEKKETESEAMKEDAAGNQKTRRITPTEKE